MPKHLLRGMSACSQLSWLPEVTVSRELTLGDLGLVLGAVIDHCLAFPSLSVYHDLPTNTSSATTLLLTGEKDEAERRALNPIRQLFEATREPGEPSEHGRGEGINGEDNVGQRIWRMDWRDKVRSLSTRSV